METERLLNVLVHHSVDMLQEFGFHIRDIEAASEPHSQNPVQIPPLNRSCISQIRIWQSGNGQSVRTVLLRADRRMLSPRPKSCGRGVKGRTSKDPCTKRKKDKNHYQTLLVGPKLSLHVFPGSRHDSLQHILLRGLIQSQWHLCQLTDLLEILRACLLEEARSGMHRLGGTSEIVKIPEGHPLNESSWAVNRWPPGIF